MRIDLDDLWLCQDCMIYAVNDDLTGIDGYLTPAEANERAKQVIWGVQALGPNLVPHFDSETGEGIDEHSRCMCAGCKTPLHGSRHRFATLTEGSDND